MSARAWQYRGCSARKGFGVAFSYQLFGGEWHPGLWLAYEGHHFEFDRRIRSALLRRDRRAAKAARR